MAGINGVTGGYSSITNGYSAAQAATANNEISKFQALVDSVQQSNIAQSEKSIMDSGEGITFNLNSIPLAQEGRLTGDYASGFAGTFTTESDKNSLPIGAAANSASLSSSTKTIDRTSKLYEKSLEMESYFVKIMLSSMRKSLSGATVSGEEKSYAQNMYDDMFYDEMATVMTKNAGFGLADQLYIQLDA